jgi:hypothetical protein
MSGKYPGNFVTLGAPAGYSVAFDGTGDYLEATSNVAFAVGSVFTLEAWVYPTTTMASGAIFISGAATNNWQFGHYTANQFGIASFGVGWRLTSSVALTLNAWNHCVFVRTGTGANQSSLFLNGVRVANGTVSDTFTTNQAAQIGATFSGYISNARVVKGVAVYDPTATTINVPTQLFNVSTSTSLLTCNSPATIDQSRNAFAITTNGNAAPSTFTPFTAYTPAPTGFNPALGAAAPGVWTLSQADSFQNNRQWPVYDPSFKQTTLMLHGNLPPSTPAWIKDASINNFDITVTGDTNATSRTPFDKTIYPTSGSGYFNGSTDYLTTPQISVGSGPFTFECWFYYTGTFASIAAFCGPGIVNNGSLSLYINNSTELAIQRYGFTPALYTVPAIQVNTWNHVAFVRDSLTNMTVFLNGTRSSTGATTSTASFAFFRTIGYVNSTVLRYFAGYLSNLRCTFSAVYDPTQTTITVPTAPLTPVAGTQLLTLQSAQPTNNSSFVDSSSNIFAITRVGNATQGTFTPFSQTGWSNYFSSGTATGTSANTAFAFGTGAFTAEGWFYNTGTTATTGVIVGANNYGVASNFVVFLNGSTNTLSYYGPTGIQANASGIPKNTWVNFAAVRSGTTVTVYVNGIASATVTDANSIPSTITLTVGGSANNNADGQFIGYISNIRLTKGGALYTSNYTPSTIPLTTTVSSGTVSLLTCQSNRFVDNSTANSGSGFALSNTGAPSVQAFSPFPPFTAYTALNVGGSGYFDGSSYLTVDGGSSLAFSTGDFSLEAFVYPTSSGTLRKIYDGRPSATAGNYPVLDIDTGNTARFLVDTTVLNTGTTVIQTNAWTHILVSRVSGNLSLFINGVQDGSTVSNSTNFANGTARPAIAVRASTLSNDPFIGYISSIRVLIGSGFTSVTVPTAPPTPVTNTSLLLNYTNAAIIDNTAKNALETVGTAQISTVQSKYGGSSMFFNGTTDYLTYPVRGADFGSGDFTIELWFYKLSTGGQRLVSARANNDGLTLGVNSSNFLTTFYGDATAVGVIAGTTTIAINTWYHVALVRNNGTATLYLNGVVEGTPTSWAAKTFTSTAYRIGTSLDSRNEYFNGYIDDLRTTTGVARYTTTFTPPTSQLQDQ